MKIITFKEIFDKIHDQKIVYTIVKADSGQLVFINRDNHYNLKCFLNEQDCEKYKREMIEQDLARPSEVQTTYITMDELFRCLNDPYYKPIHVVVNMVVYDKEDVIFDETYYNSKDLPN